MTGRLDVPRRQFVQLGSTLRVIALAGGLATAGDYDTNGGDGKSDGEGNQGKSGNNGEWTAHVRVAHLVPCAPNVDVFVDGDPVLEDVPFKAVSDYLELPAGSYEVGVAHAGEGADAAVIKEETDVPAANLTLTGVGEIGGENRPLKLAVLENDNSSPGHGTARVRAVHASPDAPAADVVVSDTGEALFEGIKFGGTASAEVPAGAYRLCVYPTGERIDAVRGADVELPGNTVASAFATGYVAPADTPADEPFDIVTTVDAKANGDTPGGEGQLARPGHPRPSSAKWG